MKKRTSGDQPFEFTWCDDLSELPREARAHEAKLHGGFVVDSGAGGGVYYGMPGCGLMKVAVDLTSQEVIELPTDLRDLNFHSTSIAEFDGKRRIIMPANTDQKVVILGLDGALDFVLNRPEFEEYQDEKKAFMPTGAIAMDGQLYVADGYGSNYISMASLREQRWQRAFAGKTDDPTEPGKFGTAHGLQFAPGGGHLVIADRPHSRVQHFSLDGHYQQAFPLTAGSRPCGIDFHEVQGRRYAVIASLDDPQPSRPAPIYIVDVENYGVVSTIRPKEELGIEQADHIHNAIWHEHDGQIYLVCQAWNPGCYFVLALSA